MSIGKVACWCFSVAVAAACICESWRLPVFAFGAEDGSRPVLAPRRAVERFVPRGERVTLLRVDRPDCPSQVCRSIFLSVAWAAGAGNVEEKRALDGCERYVVTAPFPAEPGALAGSPRYREYADSEFGRVWIRDDAPIAASADGAGEKLREIRGAGIAAVARECGEWREALGLVAPMLFALTMLAAGLGRTPSRAALAAAAAVFLPSAMFALSHTFAGPCGTGVFGGRARAFVESGCSFAALADPRLGEYFQPAYPPLQSLVTAAGYLVAGMCGEWLTQLGPVIYLAAAVLAMDGMARVGERGPERGTRRAVACGLLASACLTGPMLRAAGNFCAEPLMMLAVASGWAALRRGRARGWLLVGLAAFAKNEGIFYVPAVIAAEAAAGRLRLRGREAAALACGLAPAVLWHVGCRIAGASLYDYAEPWQCDPSRAFAAVGALLREMACHPWRYAFAAVAAACAARAWRAECKMRIGAAIRAALPPLAFFVVFAAGICWAFSTSRAPDFAWHLSCLPRLLAPASALALAAALCGARPGSAE